MVWRVDTGWGGQLPGGLDSWVCLKALLWMDLMGREGLGCIFLLGKFHEGATETAASPNIPRTQHFCSACVECFTAKRMESHLATARKGPYSRMF